MDDPSSALNTTLTFVRRALGDRGTGMWRDEVITELKGQISFLIATARPGRRFPIQGAPAIPWSVAEKAYEKYRYHGCQSLERLAERGGFGVEEMDALYPNWRSESEEIPLLRAEIARLRRIAGSALPEKESGK